MHDAEGEEMRRKGSEGAPAPTSGGTRITPTEVQQVEFRLAFRGYNERDVDAFLDRVTEDLAWYMEEIQRMRAEGSGHASSSGTEARAEAERILADARVEAERLIRDAEARAAAIGSTGGDARSAVAPFLIREREFLQSLGALVQGHAEAVKGMVQGLRGASGPPSRDEEATPAGTDAGIPEGQQAPAADAAPPDARPPEQPATSEEEAFAPISVPEAEGGEEPIPAAKQGQLRRDSGERSLRELFWGED